MWISPEFKLLLITEYQTLKQAEADRINTGWDYRRFLSKTNYIIHTDAIKQHILPELTEDQAKYAYANEADMLNVALFGLTAKQWQQKYPKEHLKGLNMRDFADVHELIVLTNLENNNAYLVSKKMPQGERLLELRNNAVSQLSSLRNSSYTLARIESPFKHNSESTTIVSPKRKNSGDPEFKNTLSTTIKKVKPSS